jgi:hypothetical protein
MKTISLETAKKLQQVAQKHNYTLPESAFYWVRWEKPTVNRWDIVSKAFTESRTLSANLYYMETVEAYNIEEFLNKIIPESVQTKADEYDSMVIINTYWFEIQKGTGYWTVLYILGDDSNPLIEIENISLLEALAQLYIYLIENEFIKDS